MASTHIINCPSCFKSFKKAGCYEKHIFQCQKRNEEKIPNNKELWDMITNLTEKYNSVKSELDTLKQRLTVQNKKLDVLGWLNNQDKPNFTWDNMIDNFKMKTTDLEFIFKKGLIEGVADIMIQYFQTFNCNEIIRCYQEKKQILYVFNDRWIIISNPEFENIFKKIYQRILVSFDEYTNENETRMRDDNDFNTEFNNNFMKILCSNIPFNSQCSRIKNKIFNKLVQPFQLNTDL